MSSIGGVDFTVDAQTDGLKKAIKRLDAFERATDKLARSQEKGASSAVTAMARQESAVRKAYQQTLNLRQQMLRQGAPIQQISNLSKAFGTLSRQMTSGRLNVAQYNRSLDGFNAKISKVKRAIKDISPPTKKLSSFADKIRNLESASVLAVGPLSGLGARIRAIASITNRSTLAIAAFLGAVAATTVAIVKMTGAAISSSRVFEEANARFLAVTDSQEAADQRMSFVVKTARRLGLRIQDLTKSYSRLTAASAGTALEGKQTENIFNAVAISAAALRLKGTDVEGTFRAIEQMMSKGNVQAEELRGQLGERLPGAFKLAADAMGATTQELNRMLKSGEIAATELLPKMAELMVAKFGKRAEDNIDGYTGSLANLNNAWILFADKVNRGIGISSTIIGLFKATTAALDSMRVNLGHVISALAGLLSGLGALAVASAIPAVVNGIILFAKTMQTATKAVAAFNITTLLTGKAVSILAKLMIMAAGAAAGLFVMENIMANVDERIKEIDEELANLSGKGLGALTSEFGTLETRIKNAAVEMKTLNAVLQLKGTRLDPRELNELYEAIFKIEKLNPSEILSLAAALEHELGRKVEVSVHGVVQALSELEGTLTTSKQEYKDWLQKFDRTPEILANVTNDIKKMGLEIEAMAGGPISLDFFNNVTSKVEDFRAKIANTTLSVAEQNAEVERYRQQLINVHTAQLNYTDVAEGMAKATLDAFGSAIIEGGSLRDVLRGLITDFMRLIYKATIYKDLESGLTNFFQAAIPGKAAPVPGTPAPVPGKAAGGSVGANQPYIVGEKGPELFVPSRSGFIHPNGSGTGSAAAGGGGAPVNINITNNIQTAGNPSNPSDFLAIQELLKQNNQKVKTDLIQMMSRKRGAFAR